MLSSIQFKILNPETKIIISISSVNIPLFNLISFHDEKVNQAGHWLVLRI